MHNEGVNKYGRIRIVSSKKTRKDVIIDCVTFTPTKYL
jgi:hypothetical protein